MKRRGRLRRGLLLFAAIGAGLLPLHRIRFRNSKGLSWETNESGYLSLQIRYPEAAPEEIEKRVTIPLEEECGRIRGLKGMQSLSEQGMSRIFLEFEGRASDSYLETREAVDRVQPLLPGEASRPEIRTYDIRDAPVFIAAFPPETESTLIEQRLGRVEGSGCVTVSDSAALEYTLENQELREGIPRSTLARAVNKNAVFGFKMGEREASMDIRPKNASDLGSLPVWGSRVSDHMRISMRKAEPEISARLNGNERIIASVQSSSQENIIPLCRGLAESASEFSGAEIVYDAGKEEERYLSRISAALLASVLVVLFVQGRPRVFPAFGYLASVLLSCSFLSLLGRSAGRAELSGAIIGGLLSAKSLAAGAQGQRALPKRFPAGAPTLLCLSASAPLLGLLGDRTMGTSLCLPSAIALASGLGMGELLKNALSARPREKVDTGFPGRKSRARSLIAAIAALSLVQLAGNKIGTIARGREDARLTCTIEFESGTQREEVERRLKDFERWLDNTEEVLRFTSVYENERAKFDIGLRERDKGFSAELEARGADIPGGFLYREGREEGIKIIVSGQDREGLNAAALGLGKRLSGLGGVQSLVYHFKEQRPALRIELDPARLSLLGVSVKETAEEIGLSLRSPVIGKMTGDEELDIRLMASPAQLSALGDRKIALRGRGMELENLASFSLKTNLGPIFRIGQSRALSLTVLPMKGIKKRDIKKLRKKIESLLASYEFRGGYRACIAGREEERNIAGLLLSGLAVITALLAGTDGRNAGISMLRAAGSIPLPLILSLVCGFSLERTAGTILAFFCAADSETRGREPPDCEGVKADIMLSIACIPFLFCEQGLADLESALASGLLSYRLLSELKKPLKAA